MTDTRPVLQEALSLGYTKRDWNTILNANRVVDSTNFALQMQGCQQVPNNLKCCNHAAIEACNDDPTKNCVMTADGHNCANGSHGC